MPRKSRNRTPEPRSPRFRDEPFLKALGDYCRKLRNKKGLSIDRLSKEAEQLSTSAIQRLETGDSPVTVLTLVRVAQGLGIHPRDLFDFPEASQIPVPSAPAARTLKVLPVDSALALKGAQRDFFPLYSAKAAAGTFGGAQVSEPEGWIRVESVSSQGRDCFIVRAQGTSMQPAVEDGDYLLFAASPTGSRQGKTVLVESRGIADPETGGSYTVKRYSSSKVIEGDGAGGGSWRHLQITLSPLNPEFEAIVLYPRSEGDVRVVGELIRNLSR